LSSASVDEWAGLSAWKSFFVDANSMNRLSSVWQSLGNRVAVSFAAATYSQSLIHSLLITLLVNV
ncbi:hypothetical protein, partial [Brevibacillus aydinogluensis]|uniref:hypothetical protein n=1 Tax=Brevibacillus aydinogluensis TaxID=927786 RepID=UPI0028937A42